MESIKGQEKSKRPNFDMPPRPPSDGEWIRIHSKTERGRPFFINTLTGASVWKLSNEDMAKAKEFENKAIKKIREAAIAKMVARGIPIEKPPSEPKREMPLKRKIINDQIIIAPQTIPAANFTQSQPFPQYEVPQMNTQVPPPNLSTIPSNLPPQVIVPNYPPPAIHTQVSNYHNPPIMPYYPPSHTPTIQMNVPHYTVPAANYGIQNGPIHGFGNMDNPVGVGVGVQSTALSMSSRFKTIDVKNKLGKKALRDNVSKELEITQKPPDIVTNTLPEPELAKKPAVAPILRPLNVTPRHHTNLRRSPFKRPQGYLRNDRIKDLREILQAKRLKNGTKKVRFLTNDNFTSEDGTPFVEKNNERDIENQMTHLNVDDKVNCNVKCNNEAEQINTNDNTQSKKPSTTVTDDIAMLNIADVKWIQKNTREEKNETLLYVKPLKELLGCGDEDLWYVMADTNVFLSNCYFLKIFVDSDENCRIVVSCRVITELEGRVNQGKSAASQEAAFAAIKFLESSPRVITVEMLFAELKVKFTNARFTTADDQILDSILQLSQHNFRVILLSNDKVLNSKTKISNVPTYTVAELKDYLFTIKVTQEESNEVTKPVLITFNNSPQSSKISVVKQTVPDTAYKSTEIQVLPVKNIADSGAQTDFSSKQILIEIPNSRTLVDKNVQTNDDVISDKQTNLKLTRKVNVETATKTGRVEKKSKWWSKRRKRDTTMNSASTSTDTDTYPKFNESPQPKTQSLHNAPRKTDSTTQFNIAQSNTDSDDSFALSKRFSGSHLVSDSSQLQPRTVEESPNSSDAVSNTICSISPDNKVIASEDIFAGVINSNLFDVSDRAMEERLKICSEEWTSRFVQIMDEVLTQVLRQNPLANNPYQPPWTIHEAAICLRKKYSNNTAIVNAATQFCFTVFSSTDKMGSIFRLLSPDQFMKLFSHGWSLVAVLHQVLSGRAGSEDLGVAKESLTKLLSDIKGLNSDTYNFVDMNTDQYLKDDNRNALESEQIVGSEGNMYQHYESSPITSTILQNPKKDPVLTQASSAHVKITRNIKINDDEGLMKYINIYNTANQFDQDEFTQSIHRTPDHSPPPEEPSAMVEASLSPETPKTNLPINESPKKIRKIQNMAEFEERIRKNNEPGTSGMDMHSTPITVPNKKKTNMVNNLKKITEYRKDNEKLDMDMLSYSEDEYENPDDKYNGYGEVINDNDDLLLEESDEYKVEGKLDDDLEVMIKTFLAEIKDTILQVRSYCEQTYLELSNDNLLNPERNLDLKEQTEDWHAFLNSLLTTLSSILLRERNSAVNVQESRFANFKISASQSANYSDIIGKCSTQVKILLDALNSIMREISVKG